MLFTRKQEAVQAMERQVENGIERGTGLKTGGRFHSRRLLHLIEFWLDTYHF